MAEHKQEIQGRAEALYLPADFFMLRAPALPAQVFIQLSNAGRVCLEAEQNEALDEVLQKGRQATLAVLLELAARPEVVLALAIASPSLIEGLARLQQSDMRKARQKRVYAGLLRYLIRMSTRPTPFGLFSGVGLGNFAARTALSLGRPAIERFRTRPDMGWLLALLHYLEQSKDLAAQLHVQLNQTAYLAGERAVLPLANTYGATDNYTVSLRATAVVRKVFEITQQPVLYTELHREVQEAFPQARSEQIDRLLWQLWEHHFLISQLHPPLTHARPAVYVRDQLEEIQGAGEIKAGLSQVIAAGEAFDQAGSSASIDLIKNLARQQERLLPASEKGRFSVGAQEWQPFQVDAALSLPATTLHVSIGRAAARAGTFLLCQTPLVDGFPHLQAYRRQFQEVYGEGAEVPLLDLLSPESGLDAPASYMHPPRSYQRPDFDPTRKDEARDQLLLKLVMEAVNRGCLEVELTEDLQHSLQRWSPKIADAPLSLEIYLQLHASTREAIDHGEWVAVVGRHCGSVHGGRTFGRFFDLLGNHGMEALRSLFAREEALLPDVIFAEISYQPWRARQANVAIRPPLRAYEIVVGTTPSVPPQRVISLNDLVVGVQKGRFYLRSQRFGKQVLVCQSHMLNPQHAPNVCRFILEIANDGRPQLNIFDWGAAATAPFLPRLAMKEGEKGKLVLTPARWHLHAETIIPLGVGSEEARWFRGVQQWRRQWRVPRYVYLSALDHRLLLDLEHPLMVEELRDEVRRQREHGQVALDELLPDFEHLWLRDTQHESYLSELVIPLLRADAPETGFIGEKAPVSKEESLRGAGVQERVLLVAERRRFPGEDWAYLKLYAAVARQDELIAGPLRQIVQTQQQQKLIDRWFFIRYSDPEPHLRLRFHAREGIAIQTILAVVLPWSASLARRGLLQRTTLETYDREVERYGGPSAIDLLEQVFTADSEVVSSIVAAQYAGQVTLDPLAIAVWTLDQFFVGWGWERQQRLEWTKTVTEKYAFRQEYRPERRRYCHLFVPGKQMEPELAEQRARLLELIGSQETTLRELSERVRGLANVHKLWIDEASLMKSLAHMHVNRLLGLDQAKEARAYAFWHHTLESLERASAWIR